jgi:hypothetical protein
MDIKDTTDMSDVWDKEFKIEPLGQLGTIQVRIPEIGAYVWFEGNSYEILHTETYQENSGEPYQSLPKATITTFCTLLEITDECEDAGKAPIVVQASQIRLI